MPRCGYVALCGLPNVGKSTLINYLLQQHLSITHNKRQTTRRVFTGIYSAPDYQIIFQDTPGWHRADQLLNRFMIDEISRALQDADIVCPIFSVDQMPDRKFISFIKNFNKNIYIIVNKIDIDKKKWRIREGMLSQLLPGVPVFPLSAGQGMGVLEWIRTLGGDLPEGPALYPEDQLTPATWREIAAEIIREAAMEYLHDEIPYQLTVELQAFKELPDQTRIEAHLVVNTDSQQGMVIGQGGRMIKRIGQRARQGLERGLGTKVFLGLEVKVDRGWVRDPQKLAKYGYRG